MKEFIFGNVVGFRLAALLKYKPFLRQIFKDFVYRVSWQNYKTAILKKKKTF